MEVFSITIRHRFDSLGDAIAYAETLNDDDAASILVEETGDDFLGEASGVFCEGCHGHPFPGIRWPTATNSDTSREWVERCDTCERYESDEDAAKALHEMYGSNVIESGEAVPCGLTSAHPYLRVD